MFSAAKAAITMMTGVIPLMPDFIWRGVIEELYGAVPSVRGCRGGWRPVLLRMRVADGGLPVMR